ncbi:NAD(P)-dependent alcohol dehydrogenase [Vagococcus sp. DIV0080]|uniref:NAD(P)-dependent alcohol dehydrogenase n=1 Tax=Candidatus Vagococcus giribetii TaxID=2230876 RepID=A0ABS3HP46_9ENTE|nr:NAD(P)-dependent alcohol dehydrogenase [Vagococcus sp. DIV0080]MBO0475514.1 NAD(P)-dependent alcohol dehydrogenase [Vagococcus sp. DIV0080]
MKIKAAVVSQEGKEYDIQTVNLAEPKESDVLVRIVASGICRSDYAERNGNSVPFPNVLGHEGAGIVEKVGPNVKDLQPGDHVLLSYGYCEECKKCHEGHPSSCYSWLNINNSGVNTRGEHVFTDEGGNSINNFFNQSSFATHSLVDQSNIVKVSKDVDLRLLGPLGCGLGTGSGAVLEVLRPKAGESIAVFGTGAVGFAALMAAKIVGCKTIIALDINEERLSIAKDLGATHVINSGVNPETVVDQVMAITNGVGVDYAIDTSGVMPVMKQALAIVGNGGTFVPLAVTKKDFEVNTFFDLVFGNKKIVGCLIGDTIPKYHLPRLIDFYLQGQFPFDQFIKFYDFEEINEAEADLISGKTLKSVLVMDKTYQPPK